MQSKYLLNIVREECAGPLHFSKIHVSEDRNIEQLKHCDNLQFGLR